MAYTQDPLNIKGIGNLLNPAMSKPGTSFIDIEDELIHKHHKKPHRSESKEITSSAKFDKYLDELETSFRTNVREHHDHKDHHDHKERKERREHRRHEEKRRSSKESSRGSSSNYSERSSSTSSASSGSGSYEDDDYEDDGSEYTDESGSRSSRSSRNSRNYRSSIPAPRFSDSQMRQDRLTSALGDGPEFTLERERYAELRSAKLEKIESMRQTLEDEGIDCSKIDTVTSEDADEKIEAIYRTLNHKLDRVRYCSLADELILAGVNGLESIFDGKRVYFGKYRPDLTNWNITVQAKLRRVQPETAMIVGAVMRDYNISPLWRIAMELVPSAISHMRLRAKQDDNSSLYHDIELSKALNEMRESKD
jgi:hypothetical protein